MNSPGCSRWPTWRVEVTPVSQVPAGQKAADLLGARDFGGFEHSKRSAEQEQIGVFWSYDGSSGIGTPPRLYNQFIVAVALGGNGRRRTSQSAQPPILQRPVFS